MSSILRIVTLKLPTNLQLANYVGKYGELTIDMANGQLNLHDGETPGGYTIIGGDDDDNEGGGGGGGGDNITTTVNSPSVMSSGRPGEVVEDCYASGIYGDMIVGNAYLNGGTSARGFVFTTGAGYYDIGTLPDSADTRPAAINGSWITGSIRPLGTSDYHAFTWNNSEGINADDLGVYTDGATYSVGSDVSANGKIVGTADVGGGENHAFRTGDYAQLPMVDLGSLGAFSGASAISDDGAFIVGYSESNGNVVPVIWAEDNIAAMAPLPGSYTSGGANDVINSDSGPTIVGYLSVDNGNTSRPFLWNDGGWIVLSSPPGGMHTASANGITIDGRYLMIDAHGDDSEIHRGFLYDRETGQYTSLGVIDGEDTSTVPTGISLVGDEPVIVGSAGGGDSRGPFKWTQADGLVSLGSMPGGIVSVQDGKWDTDPVNPANELVFYGLRLVNRGGGIAEIHLEPSQGFHLRENGMARGYGAVDLQLNIGKNSDSEVANDFGSSILGGANNTTSEGQYQVIGGGQGNLAQGNYCFIGGGGSNEIDSDGQGAVLGGGYSNMISGQNGFLGGGENNEVSGLLASVVGGSNNVASGDFSWIPGGFGATTDEVIGKGAFASGFFSEFGDAQISWLVLRGITTHSAPYTLTSDGGNTTSVNQIVIKALKCVALTINVLAVSNADNECAFFKIEALAKGDGSGNVTLVGTPSVETISADGGANTWTVELVPDVPTLLNLIATGEDGKFINWLAEVNAREISFQVP